MQCHKIDHISSLTILHEKELCLKSKIASFCLVFQSYMYCDWLSDTINVL